MTLDSGLWTLDFNPSRITHHASHINLIQSKPGYFKVKAAPAKDLLADEDVKRAYLGGDVTN